MLKHFGFSKPSSGLKDGQKSVARTRRFSKTETF